MELFKADPLISKIFESVKDTSGVNNPEEASLQRLSAIIRAGKIAEIYLGDSIAQELFR